MLQYAYLIILFPLLGCLINGLVGRRLPRLLVSLVACGSVAGSFVLSALCFFELAHLEPEMRVAPQIVQATVFSWIPVGDLQISFATFADPLAIVMCLVVSGVSFLIHVYSVGYMAEDEDYPRYFTYLNLFAGSMLLLVLAHNFLVFFVGWEMVGLCSYLLIGFWFERATAAAAGLKAFVVNRIGDFGFLVGILAIFALFGTLDFREVFAQASSQFGPGDPWMLAIALLLFVGATGKSAQIPLYVWLPDAMEGPTPVSALIHAATMVTAGVYMVARCSVLYALAPAALVVVAAIGAATAIYAASIAVTQYDFKRVLAYSTISQLGYMFLACGVGAFAAGIFHLMTHAFFKALLFLCAGAVMHALHGELDIRNMGGLRKHLPITRTTFLVACLAIAGVPIFAGFFSKDEILWSAFSRGGALGLGCWIVGALAALMTAFYMFRLYYVVFAGEPRMSEEEQQHIHEAPTSMALPLVLLAILSVIGGLVWIPFWEQGKVFKGWLEPVFEPAVRIMGGEHGLHSTPLEAMVMAVSVLLAICGIYLAYRAYLLVPDLPNRIKRGLGGLYRLVYDKYRIDELYAAVVVSPGHRLSQWCWQFVDVKVVDAAVNGLAEAFGQFGQALRRTQTGYVRHYALATVLGALIMLVYYLLR
ncbi:MAG: NADH-quinone oxidoreductase subunit L [Armatimonadota bacterium]